MPTSARRFERKPLLRRSLARRRLEGFSLLEVILALALSVIVIGTVMTAIFLHLSVLDKRRGKIERAQLARNLLSTIANDIRSAVQYKPVDVSQLEQMLAGGDITSMLGTPGGDASLGALAESGAADDLNSPLDLTNGADMLSGGLEGGALGGDEMLDDSAATSSSQDIASTVAPPTEPGIYGNEFEIQIDTSRLPRKDQYNPMLISSNQTDMGVTSDIKTIAYYLEIASADSDIGANGLESLVLTGGLARRTVDRAVARFATNNGGTLDGIGRSEIVAPEVTQLSFRYFDGTDWLTEWDSDAMETLPMAIEISIVLSELDEDGVPIPTENEQAIQDNLYRLVVHLPIAEAATAEEEPFDGEDPMADEQGDAGSGTDGGSDSGAPAGDDTGQGGGGFSSGAGSAATGGDR